MKLTVFGSSSEGNGYALEFDNGLILLLEAGTPYSKVYGAYPGRWSDIIGCFITHEHGDHTRHIKEYAMNGIRIFATQGTLDKVLPDHITAKPILSNAWFQLENISIYAFAVKHNAADPVGYLIVDLISKESLLFITDTVYFKPYFTGVTYMMVECNYITEIALANVRDDGNTGFDNHLSLETCIKFLGACDLKKTTQIILVHLSDRNSNQKRMVREVYEKTNVDTVAAEPGMVRNLRKDAF